MMVRRQCRRQVSKGGRWFAGFGKGGVKDQHAYLSGKVVFASGILGEVYYIIEAYECSRGLRMINKNKKGNGKRLWQRYGKDWHRFF